MNNRLSNNNLGCGDISKLRRRVFCGGVTLIEAVLAIMIIMIVAVAGSAFPFYSSGRIALDRNRRLAL